MNTHIQEEQLVAFAYGDAERPQEIEQHLGGCTQCAAELARLKQVLAEVNESTLPVPDRGEHYHAQVWASIRPQLAEKPKQNWFAWLRPRQAVWAGALAALLVVAFFAGRISRPNAPVEVVEKSPEHNQRALLAAEVVRHLDRSQMMLVELSNTEPEKGGTDISAEQQRARDLLTANRLYRESAKRAKDPAVGAILDQLEQVLVEIANAPPDLPPARLEELQNQIEEQGILFKIRVMQSQQKHGKAKGAQTPQRKT
jgi:hypothetical protein